MARAARPGGAIVVLDYNHARNSWDPDPPADFAACYSAFLSWRAANGWDNEMADHCASLFEDVGLHDIRVHDQDEIGVRGDAYFERKTSLWSDVFDTIGPTLEAAGVCEARAMLAARRGYDAWRATVLMRQTLSMKTTVGRAR